MLGPNSLIVRDPMSWCYCGFYWLPSGYWHHYGRFTLTRGERSKGCFRNICPEWSKDYFRVRVGLGFRAPRHSRKLTITQLVKYSLWYAIILISGIFKCVEISTSCLVGKCPELINVGILVQPLVRCYERFSTIFPFFLKSKFKAYTSVALLLWHQISNH